jgi:hypothetical protein
LLIGLSQGIYHFRRLKHTCKHPIFSLEAGFASLTHNRLRQGIVKDSCIIYFRRFSSEQGVANIAEGLLSDLVPDLSNLLS